MSGILYDARKIKAYEAMQRLGKYAGMTREFLDTLWMEMLSDPELMEEFFYYLENLTFKDALKIDGFSMTDVYFWVLRQYTARQDYGKNMEECNKFQMSLEAFHKMAEIKQDPIQFQKSFEQGLGMDMF